MGVNFWDIGTWSFIITISILLVGMLLANALRRRVAFIKRSLLPSPVLAGFMLLAVNLIMKYCFNFNIFEGATLESLTYHGLGLGFVAVSLKSSEKTNNKAVAKAYFNTGLTTVSSYLLQGILGISITIGLSYILPKVFPASGLILPMGFGQGPGQAYNWGKTYQDTYGFENGASFGLTIAATGFIVAALGGTYHLRKMQKAGKINLDRLGDGTSASIAEQVSGLNEIPDSDSLDKMTIQIALVFLGYIITFIIMNTLYQLFLWSGNSFLLGTVNPLIWGFNFLIGTIVAVVMKNVLNKCYNKKIITRVYTNDYMLTRLSGVFFDMMVVASICAIDLKAFTKIEFIVPIILLAVVGMVASYYQLRFVCKTLFKEYEDEQFLALFGMQTGTASTAIVLLREIDPYLKTPAANNIVFQSLYAIIFGFPMLLLLGFAPRTTLGPNGWAFITLGACIVLFIGMQLLSFREQIFKKKSK